MPLKRYTSFVEKITETDGPHSNAPKIKTFKKFQALKNFLALDGFTSQGIPDHVGQPSITVATLSAAGGLLFDDVAVKDLFALIDDGEFQLFIVQNVTPEVVEILGDCLQVDPQFFLDFIDAMPGDFDITKEEKSNRPDIIPTPWYRIQSPEAHLPMLHSLRGEYDHIHITFVAPRQYDKANNHGAKERMPPDLRKMKVERIGGLQTPVTREIGEGGMQFNNVAMTRHCASMWFKRPTDPSNPGWTKGIVLLDPPFEVDDVGEKEYGRRLPSDYRSFVSRPIPFELDEKDWDVRSGYKGSLVHYLKHCPKFQDSNAFHPILVARGIIRIVASEWIATNLYIERDLNSMEWRLESSDVGIDVLENFLGKLFILRRRIGKYAQLIDDQMSLFQEDHMPSAWTAHLPHLAKGWLRDAQQDSAQVRDIVQRNAERVSKTVDLIMSIISVRESRQSVEQNDSLKILAVVATIALPFNAVAAVMAIDGEYGPGGKRFWVYFTISIPLCTLIWMIYAGVRVVKKERHRTTTRDKRVH